jgi:hypothetical protein
LIQPGVGRQQEERKQLQEIKKEELWGTKKKLDICPFLRTNK